MSNCNTNDEFIGCPKRKSVNIPPLKAAESKKEQKIVMFTQDHAVEYMTKINDFLNKGYLVKSVTMAATGVYCYTTIVLEK